MDIFAGAIPDILIILPIIRARAKILTNVKRTCTTVGIRRNAEIQKKVMNVTVRKAIGGRLAANSVRTSMSAPQMGACVGK